MSFPNQYLNNPSWHAKPIEERERELSSADPEFAKFPKEKRAEILQRAAAKYGRRKAEGFAERAATDLSLGWQSGRADLAKSIANVTDVIGFKNASKKIREMGGPAPPPEVVSGHGSVLDQVLQGVGSAPATMAKYVPAQLAGRYAPLAAGAVGFVSNLDKGVGEATKEGLKDALMFGAMGKTSKLPTRTARAVGGAVVAGGTTALTGGNPKQVMSSAILGGGFGAASGKQREKSAMTPEQAKALLEGGVNSVAKVRDMVRQQVAPQNRGPEARKTAHIIRANVSDVYRQADIADYALRQAQKAFRLMPDEQRLSVIDAIERGTPQKTVQWKSLFGGKTVEAKQMQEFVDTMRQIHNSVRDELIEVSSRVDPKTGEKVPTALKSVAQGLMNPDEALRSYYENYFPHLFTDPDKAAGLMQGYYSGKRPLRGPATFLHQRKHPTIQDALWTVNEDGTKTPTGLKLVTTDPVEAYMLKWREMKRFTSAQKIIREMEQSGLVEWVSPGRRGPAGWVEIKDNAFRRFKQAKDGTREMVGSAWAPEPAARVLNNYLSPGLRGIAPFQHILAFNNVLNQAQLGMSAFHMGFTSVDAVTSRFALGLEQTIEGARRGDVGMAAKGAVNLAKSTPLGAPFTLIENLRLGRDMRAEWRKPGSSGNPEIAKLVGMIQEAGGGVSLDPVYRTNMTHRITEAIRMHEGFLKTVWRVPFAISEQVANLIMDKFVPMQKLGVFGDLARFELDRLPQGATQMQVREAMAKAWDSVDNRMGMLRYDNLFWNKWVKDMAMMSTRSVGWNLGTLREIGGGAMDWGKLLQKGNKEFTHRMAYTLALPAVAGMMGGVIHWAYNGKAPEQVMDWFFPRTGRKDEFGRDERISIPSYIKDIYHVYLGAKDWQTGLGPKKLIGVAGAKLHPAISLVSDMLANRDFYNTEIANSDDPVIKRALDTAKFVGTQYSPFSWSNVARERKLGFPLSEQALTMVGFVPAPADIKKTPAERLATEIMAENLPKRSNTREERERQDRRRELERKIRVQDNWESYAQQALDEGALSENDIVYAMDRASGLPLDRSFQRMRLADAVKVYRVATSEEKRRLKQLFAEKVDRNVDQIEALPAAQRKKLAQQIMEILNEPIPTAPPGGNQ